MTNSERQVIFEFPTNATSFFVQAVFIFYTLGFYVYSIMVFNGMQPYLRGFLVASALVCAPLLLIPYVKMLLHPASHRTIDIIFWLTLAYFGVWLFFVGAKETHPIEFSNYSGAIVSWTMLFMLGRSIPVYAKGLYLVASIVYLSIIVLISINTESGAFVPAQSSGEFATYQSYAIILTIVTFTLLYHVDRKILFWLIAMTSIILFAVLGSRSELVAMVFATGVISNLRGISAVMIALQVIAGSILYGAYILLTSGGWNRFVNFVDEGAESTISARLEVNTQAITSIMKSPLTGEFGNYEEGYYAHNILSVWVDFGIVGFFMIVLLMTIAVYLLLFGTPFPLRDRRNVIAIAMWSFCALLLLLAKSGEYYVTAFVLGLIASHHSITQSSR